MMRQKFQHPFSQHRLKTYNGSEVAYIDEGDGEQTIFFIHGLATYSYSWAKNIAELKNRYRCIAIDLPGNGYSPHGDYPYSIPFFANTVIDIIGKLGLKQVCIAGHSMGGQVAITTLLHEPGCADKLILCAPAGFEQFSPMEKNLYHGAVSFFDFFSTEENNLRQTLRSSFYNAPHQADGLIEELVALMKSYPAKSYRKMIDLCVEGMLHYPVFDRLNLIKQPALVMFGERDALIPNRLLHPVTTRQVATEGVTQMPNATLKMIPKCGHFLQWEKANLVNEFISDWLS